MGKTVAQNRKARHDYSIEETLEAGIALTGTEIKSVREGHVNLQDAYARIERGEAWLVGAHVAPWSGGNRYNHEPRRDRKLLLHRTQIDQLAGKTRAKGLTLVPLAMYFNDRGRAKVQLGLARGKKNYDRRRDIAARDARRDMDRDMADALRGR
jgi:SsrA-binding protein